MVTPTEAQQLIRDHEGLGLLVVAPAGCGKTEALALRVAGLIERGATQGGRRVLVTTFSNRARDNIRDRLRSYLPSAVLRDHVEVRNFHGLSARIFQAHAKTIGLDPAWPIPDSNWVREQCHAWGWDWPQITPAEDALRRAKQNPLDDSGVQEYLLNEGAAGALALEQKRLDEKRLSYDDLPRIAELILANEGVAELYREHFGAVVVDEYQDLTPQQLRIVNRIGFDKTTYAGDLAQGIYGFAGAEPSIVDVRVREECSVVIPFAESHRSSPAVLDMVNSLGELTGGLPLTSAQPDSWPGGGLKAAIQFEDPTDEAHWAVQFGRTILEHAPKQRIGIICPTAPRREAADSVAEASGLPVFRWDDGVLDTETARLLKIMLVKINASEVLAAADPLQFLREVSGLEAAVDTDTRRSLAEALMWCLERLREGATPLEIRDRIRVGDQDTLLTAAGIHLLSGHVGKGQQFDWVVVIGAEDGLIPHFSASTDDEVLEGARLLAVMISRARHGAIVTCAKNVAARSGRIWRKNPSRFFRHLSTASLRDAAGVQHFLDSTDWRAVSAR